MLNRLLSHSNVLILSFALVSCGGFENAPTSNDKIQFSCRQHSFVENVSAFHRLSQTDFSIIEFNLRDATEGNSNFTQYDILSGMSYSYGFNTFDYDCDGKLDISFFDSYAGGRKFMRTQEGAIGYLKWFGAEVEKFIEAETFQDTIQPLSIAHLFERHIAFDINNDKIPDIVGVANSNAAIVAYINPGVRGVKWERRYISKNTPGAVNIASGDIDGDGLPDLVVSLRDQPSTNPNPKTRGIVWFKNPGRDDLTWVQSEVSGTGDLIDPRTLLIGDVNADGKPDIIYSDASTGNLGWIRNAGNNVWYKTIIGGVNTIHGHFGRIVDYDNDGRIDIIHPVYQGIKVLRNVDGGTNWEMINIATFARESKQIVVSDVAVGDLDLDGGTDVAFTISSLSSSASAQQRGGLYILFQRQGYWSLQKVAEEDSSYVGLILVDYDNDGDLDIISNTEYQRNAITFWRNTKISIRSEKPGY